MTTTANPLGIRSGDWVTPREPMRMLDLCNEETVEVDTDERLFVEIVKGETVNVSGRDGVLGGWFPFTAFVPMVLADLSPADLDETVVTDVTVPYLEPGQTVIHGAQRYTVDHVECDDDYAAVFTTAGIGAILTPRVYQSLRTVTVRGIPASPTMDGGRKAGEEVHFWSGVRLDGPATLVRRDVVRAGDTVHSSHYGKRVVTEATQHGTEGQTTEIRFFSNDTEQPRIERADSDTLIPRYETAKPEAESLEDALWAAIKNLQRTVPEVSTMGIVYTVLDTLRERGIDVEG